MTTDRATAGGSRRGWARDAAAPKPAGGNRPAGTYEVQAGDSFSAIRKKFCVSTNALLAANQWPSINVFLFPGKKINIPPAGT